MRVVTLELDQMVTLAIGAFITAVVGSLVSWFKGTYNSYSERLRKKDAIIEELIHSKETLETDLEEQGRKLQEVQKSIKLLLSW